MLKSESGSNKSKRHRQYKKGHRETKSASP